MSRFFSMNRLYLFMRLSLVATALWSFSYTLQAQVTSGLIANFNFANCEVADQTGNNESFIVGMPPMCDCGIVTDALEFDGSDQFIVVDSASNINALFTRASFSISLYFRPLASNGNMVLFSKRESCLVDRGFAVYYNANFNEITIEFEENATNRIRASHRLPDDRCWQHLVISRIGTTVRLFVNGEEVIQERSGSVIQLTNERPFEVGTGPCVGTTAVPLNGLISDLRFYSRDLSQNEVNQLFRNQDKIINRDTTIFLGQEVQILDGPNCSNNIQWTPTTDIDDPSVSDPIITPQQTREYALAINYGICTARDSILITVIDPTTLDCTELPMPNIFTPNDDGLNDAYGISNPFTLDELVSFEIFDRNGNKMFSTNDPLEEWDGSFRGERMPPGAYLYMIKYVCDGETIVKTDSFHLMR